VAEASRGMASLIWEVSNNRGSTLRLAAIAVLLVVPVTPAQGRTTPEQKCQAAKVRAARNEVYGKMGCNATARRRRFPSIQTA
jgi:hypothetical protein